MNIAFIGFGHMAKAIAGRLANFPDFSIAAAAPSLPVGKTAEGISTHHDNLAILKGRDLIFLAVKPLQSTEVLKQIGHILPNNSLLVSLVAGLNLASLLKYCRPEQALVRAMPNLPVSVGFGATALLPNSWVHPKQKVQVEQLFQTCGITSWLNNEAELDAFTALSGSGPAYLFYFLEALIAAGKQLGLNEELAERFVLQSMMGAMQLAMTGQTSPRALRQQVSSAKGTTAAGIEVFEKNELDRIILQAVQAAATRAKELAKLQT